MMPAVRYSLTTCLCLAQLALPAHAQITEPASPNAERRVASGAVSTGYLDFPDCPVKALRKAYQSLLTEQDTFNILAVDEQLILVCRERQALIKAYKIGAKDIAEGLHEMVLQNQDLVAAQGAELRAKNAEIQAAEDLAKIIAETRRADLKLSALKQAIHAFGDASAGVTPSSNRADTDGCELRYSLIGTGMRGGKAYAMIADEVHGSSRTVEAGDTLPFGGNVVSINGLKVIVRTPSGTKPLPFVSEHWELAPDSPESASGGLLWHKVDPAKSSNGIKSPTSPAKITVFEGYSVK